MSAQWPPPDSATTPRPPVAPPTGPAEPTAPSRSAASGGPASPTQPVWAPPAAVTGPRQPTAPFPYAQDAPPPHSHPPYAYTQDTYPPHPYARGGQPFTGGQPWWPQGEAYPHGPPPSWTPPRHLADQPPPRPPSRQGWLVALFGGVAVVLAGLVAPALTPLLGSLVPAGSDQSTSRPAPNASSPASLPTGAADRADSATPAMPTDPEVLLKKNPIYAIKVSANCPSQSTPPTKAAFRTQVKALLDCQNSAWRKALKKTPVTFSKPKVVFYDTSTNSPCGRLGDAHPAAYCTSNRTLYFATAAYVQGSYYRLAVAQFVMHEYAHHVQELAGIFTSDQAMDEKSAVTTRRIELQAHCVAHYQLTHSGIGFSASDRADAEYQFSYTTDAKGHGSVTAEQYWGRRGLDASRIGACNTWRVPAGQVK